PQGMYDAGYRVGDVIAAIIYDGYVWTTPDFEITLTPRPPDDNGISGDYPDSLMTAVVYDVSIQRAGAANAQWYNPLNFSLAFSFSEPPLPSSGTHVVMTKPDLTSVELSGPTYAISVTGVLEAVGWDGTLSVYSDSAGPLITQTIKYLSGLNVIADSSSGSKRGAASNYGFGQISPDYALSTSDGSLVVRQDGNATVHLTSFGGPGVGTACNNLDTTAEIRSDVGALPWDFYFSPISPPIKVTIKRNTYKTESFSLAALANAPTGNYDLRLTVPASSCGPAHSLDIPLTILPPASNATPNKYVNVQGYAAFRISYMDANDVKGHAISRIYLDPNEIQYGLRPRLVPWG
ncbi:MAG TPA: hypothetical protein VFL17_12555, partial [Anaerolineae bacterium]|nr:hypothetical protein [Anaerolineae bacterium]